MAILVGASILKGILYKVIPDLLIYLVVELMSFLVFCIRKVIPVTFMGFKLLEILPPSLTSYLLMIVSFLSGKMRRKLIPPPKSYTLTN